MPRPQQRLPPRRPLPSRRLLDLSRRSMRAAATASAPSPAGRSPLRYAVLGAGFAGLSVAWHLLKHSTGNEVRVDIYDENGVGGGASGVAGGLLHPYSPKVKLLWRGAEFWKECMDLLRCSEQANGTTGSAVTTEDETLIWRREIVRPPTSEKAADILLEALFLACQNLVDEASMSSAQKEFKLHREHIDNLQQLAGDYDSVIICLGAKASSLPELSNKLPLRTCRGVIAEFELPSDNKVEEFGSQSPSILSDAWLAFQGPRTVSIGSTWQWQSENYASTVSSEEAWTAIEELLPKASGVYPGITKWDFVRARAGIRAMPPLTTNGSLPLLGCLNGIIGYRSNCKFWLVGGLGARGLLYHGLVGKLTAEAVIFCDEDKIPSEFTCWKARA